MRLKRLPVMTNVENSPLRMLCFFHKNLEHRCLWGTIILAVASLLVCSIISQLFVSGYGIVKNSSVDQDRGQLVYHIPQGLFPDEREFAIASMALPVILVSQEEEFSAGEYGVVFQVDKTTPQELEDAFGISIESDKELVYILFAFVFAEDRDSQSARITLADTVYIDLNHRAVSVFGWLYGGIRDGHSGDIENLLLVYERDIQEGQPTEYLTLIAVAPKQHTNGFVAIPPEQVNINDEGRLVFNAQEKKNTLSEDERSCQNLNVAEYFGLVSINGFGCYPPEEARALDLQILPSHNVGESYDQRNPFAISPLLSQFSDLDAWAERPEGPFGAGRAFFEWLN